MKKNRHLKSILTLSICILNLYLFAQQKVSGIVTDKSNIPMIGVNVVIEGTAKGTITDLDGQYTIDVSPNASLIFSFVGYEPQTIAVGTNTVINVILNEGQVLDEIVVVGYGTVKKSDLTGAVSSLKGDVLTERPVPTINQAIQGRVSGVQARTNSAAPGGGMNIVIRGTGSINSSTTPLYVVNGIPVADVSNIPTEDIESVEILKDASATAIYGSRGANGVVLLTTKKGALGKPTLTYANRVTFEQIRNNLNLMSGPEFARFFTDWELANGANPSNVFYNGSDDLHPLPQNATNTDWFKEITRQGVLQNHNLSLSGGTDASMYSVSLNYLDHKGVIVGGDYSRLSMTINNSYNINYKNLYDNSY